MIEERRELIACAGPFFDHWRRRCAAAFGVLPPEPPDTTGGDIST